MARIKHARGTSLVEIILGVSIMLLVFGALFQSFDVAVEFGVRNQLRVAALLLANEQLEVLRGLPYDAVGTVNGLPPGGIPQTEDIVKDGHTYTRRTFIQYVDDPADGLDTADTLTADYKRVKVEMSYTYRGEVQTFSLVTTVAPRSQESLAGAGILRINAINAANNPVPSATVHVLNTTVATSVNITTFTNASGTVSFPGAWAGTGYVITVSKPGYSTAQTYVASTTNPNPSPSPATVALDTTTEIYFKIDLTSSLHLTTRAWPVRNRFLDTFDDSSNLVLQNTQVLGGELVLAGVSGSYVGNGTASSSAIMPAALDSWVLFSFDDATPHATDVYYQIAYESSGSYLLVPESDLPGNTAGFTTSPIDLHTLATSTYRTLLILATLSTSDPFVTPSIREWKVSHLEPATPMNSVTISLHGDKTIGTDSGGNPLYKYTSTSQTNAQGVLTFDDLEWDRYTLSIPDYTTAEACPSLPVDLPPNTDYTETLTLASPSTNTLAVHVLELFGGAIPYAEVRVVGGATDTVRVTGPCGTAYFPSLAEITYAVSVEAGGYATTSGSVAVSGATETSFSLIP